MNSVRQLLREIRWLSVLAAVLVLGALVIVGFVLYGALTGAPIYAAGVLVLAAIAVQMLDR